MRLIIACVHIGGSRAALGIGLVVEELVDMARSRVLVHLDSLQLVSRSVCDSLVAGPYCTRTHFGDYVAARGIIPDALRSARKSDSNIFKAVVTAAATGGLSLAVPPQLGSRPSAGFVRRAWSAAGEGDLEWVVTNRTTVVTPEVVSPMCYGAFQVVFKQAVVLTSLMVRIAEPGGYVLVRGVMVSLSIKEELRWWCVLTQVGDHNVIEVARRFSSVRARWGKVSLPIDGLDITRVTFYSNRPIEILSMGAITEGPTTRQDGKATVLVLTRPTRGWVEAVVGPKAPYVDMTTVMREGFTWNSERELHTSLPPPDSVFTMAKLRRVLTHLSAHQCCFCGEDDVLRTAKNLVYRMEQVVGTRWGRLVAGSIDAIVEYSVASATMHYDVKFLSAMAMSSAIECEKKECPVPDPTGESLKASLLRRLGWIEKAYDKARETSRAERGRSYTITAGAELTKQQQPYTHQQQQRASSRLDRSSGLCSMLLVLGRLLRQLSCWTS